jgi:hypothetical protein
MSFYQALPPFGIKQWCLVTLLLLDVLTEQCLPGIVLSNNQVITGKVLPCIIFSILELCILHKVEVEVEIARQVFFLGLRLQQCPFQAQAG